MNKFKNIDLMSLITILLESIFLAFNTNTAFGQEKREFYLFPVEIEGVEEEILKIPHDSFSVKTMIAKKGDNITVHYYNTEAQEKHNFVLLNPYNITKDLPGGQHAKISFIADKEGLFQYECTYHMPTMTGQLLVLP
jgi:plastocyanin